MSVKLCYRAALEELTGRREEYIEARAVGESIQLRGGFAAPLRDGDTLSFLPF